MVRHRWTTIPGASDVPSVSDTRKLRWVTQLMAYGANKKCVYAPENGHPVVHDNSSMCYREGSHLVIFDREQLREYRLKVRGEYWGLRPPFVAVHTHDTRCRLWNYRTRRCIYTWETGILLTPNQWRSIIVGSEFVVLNAWNDNFLLLLRVDGAGG